MAQDMKSPIKTSASSNVLALSRIALNSTPGGRSTPGPPASNDDTAEVLCLVSWTSFEAWVEALIHKLERYYGTNGWLGQR